MVYDCSWWHVVLWFMIVVGDMLCYGLWSGFNRFICKKDTGGWVQFYLSIKDKIMFATEIELPTGNPFSIGTNINNIICWIWNMNNCAFIKIKTIWNNSNYPIFGCHIWINISFVQWWYFINTSRCKLRRLDWLYSLCSNKTYIPIISYTYKSSKILCTNYCINCIIGTILKKFRILETD
jgi:hypothetical protein